MNTTSADPQWKALYRIAAIAAILVVIVMILAVVLYFIYPYAPDKQTAETIFLLLQRDVLGGLISLDILLLAGNLVGIPVFLALYVSLKPVNASYTLIALALAIIGIVLLFPARPLLELVTLSKHYAAATGEAEKSQYLAAGTALLALFDGINWFMNTLLGGISLLISSVLMLQSNVFSKTTARVGIITNVAVCGFFLPVIGVLLLFLTLPGYTIWYMLLARRFFQMGRSEPA